VGLETLASCLAVSPLAGSAGSLNRGLNNSGRRHGDGRRAALRDEERQTHGCIVARKAKMGQGKLENRRR